jgi:hypothetical protein
VQQGYDLDSISSWSLAHPLQRLDQKGETWFITTSKEKEIKLVCFIQRRGRWWSPGATRYATRVEAGSDERRGNRACDGELWLG